jgi:hypothetical protein
MTSNDAPGAARRILDLQRAATRELRKAVAAEGADRTHHLRATADLLVDLRALHLDAEGAPDWRGKTFAYRDLVNSVYAAAGLPPESGDTTKTALRYHVGNALRERLTPDELDEVGLSALDPRDRQASRRASLGEGTSATPDRLIADLNLSARRLQESRGKVTAHDLARAEDAKRALDVWLTAHRAQA